MGSSSVPALSGNEILSSNSSSIFSGAILLTLLLIFQPFSLPITSSFWILFAISLISSF
jgi:hypothetical protein